MASTFNKKNKTPEGWEEGNPPKSETGNYYLNGSEKMVYLWDGRDWNRATKDVFGELNWHTRLDKQPKVKYHKLIKHLNLS